MSPRASLVASPELADQGAQRIEWARANMPILRALEAEFRRDRPFEGMRAAVSIHLEAKTAYLALVLRDGGAQVAVTGSNSGSTKDDIVAALAREENVYVYAHHGASPAAMLDYRVAAIELEPQIVIDDGGDLVELLHDDYATIGRGVLGACEETTSGVLRARARAEAGELAFPVLLINDARCKYLFDNVHGTGQSVWDAVMRSTNQVIAGKVVAIAGFGWCGAGCALRAQGLGARVIVSEVDPVKAADAAMRGFDVAPLAHACERADIVLTVTGVKDTLTPEHFAGMKDGTLVANAGHFRNEVDVDALASLSSESRSFRENVTGYRLEDRWIHVLGDGNIVNIACGDGHPAEIMDTSFALQALSARHVADNAGRLDAAPIDIPKEIDERVARLKLQSMSLEIDELTAEQKDYLSSWEHE
ncbi:MAG: adenosylhomocysteinase [Acidobacteriota bacterium]